MEGVLELLPSVLNGRSVPHLESYLDACVEHVAFHVRGTKSEPYIKLINTHLNKNETRLEGLLVLKVALQQCPIEEFEGNAKSWMSHCVKGSFDKNPSVANASFSVLGTLLKNAVNFPDIKKYASANIVPNALDHAKRDINSETIQSLLHCLIVCIQEYTGSCSESYRFILNLLTRLLNSESLLLSLAAKCYALFSQVKMKGIQGVNNAGDAWKTNQLVLVHTLHHYLDILFSSVDEIQTAHRPSKGDIELLIAKRLNESASVSDRMQYILKNVKGLSKFLQAMLLGSFPVAKRVMPDVIIGLICRGLAVTCQSLGSITTDTLALGCVLPEVHSELLRILIALITCCGRNLIQYGSVICKLINQELKWTSSSDWPYDLDKPFRNLRSAVYSCLHCWLTITRSASSIEIVIGEIVQYILYDIHMNKPVVTLKPKGGNIKKNQPQYNFLCDNRSDKLGTKLANKGLCFHALKCLQLVLYSSTIYMKSPLCKVIQESVVTLLLQVQNTLDGPPVPYSSGACRKELYSSLVALCMEPHPTFPPPLNYALAIFKTGLTDPLTEVSFICSTALSNLEKIIHPSAPSLHCNLQWDTIQQYSEDNVDNSTINSTPPSIKDMPLSAFPNLNNVIVVKVYDKNDNKERDEDLHGGCSIDQETSNSGLIENSKCTKSVRKTTIQVNGVNSINYNCNLGDIISMNKSFTNDGCIVNDRINNCNESKGVGDIFSNANIRCSVDNIDGIVKPTEKISLFEKINGLCDDVITDNVLVASSVIASNEVPITGEQSSLVNEANTLPNDFPSEPPMKKLKVFDKVNGLKNETEIRSNSDGIEARMDISETVLMNSATNVMNGETKLVIDEDEMMNCFVDVVQQ